MFISFIGFKGAGKCFVIKNSIFGNYELIYKK